MDKTEIKTKTKKWLVPTLIVLASVWIVVNAYQTALITNVSSRLTSIENKVAAIESRKKELNYTVNEIEDDIQQIKLRIIDKQRQLERIKEYLNDEQE